jgi:hypothetical protein
MHRRTHAHATAPARATTNAQLEFQTSVLIVLGTIFWPMPCGKAMSLTADRAEMALTRWERFHTSPVGI